MKKSFKNKMKAKFADKTQSKRLSEVVSDQFIGELLTISEKKMNKNSKPISGVAINETKFMITIQLANGEIKRYPKAQIEIERKYKNHNIKIHGSLLKGRPEERIKSKLKKRW